MEAQRTLNRTESEVLDLAEDYGQWMWDAGYMDNPTGETLVDEAEFKRQEIRTALEKALYDAYAEGRKDEREALMASLNGFAHKDLVDLFFKAMEWGNQYWAYFSMTGTEHRTIAEEFAYKARAMAIAKAMGSKHPAAPTVRCLAPNCVCPPEADDLRRSCALRDSHERRARQDGHT